MDTFVLKIQTIVTVFFWATSELCYYLSNYNIVGFVVKWWAIALVSCDPALGSAVNTRHTCSGITWKMVNKCPEKCWILWRWVGRSGSNPCGVLGLPRGQGCWPSSCKCNIFEYGRNTSQIIIRQDKFCLLTSLIGFFVLCKWEANGQWVGKYQQWEYVFVWRFVWCLAKVGS